MNQGGYVTLVGYVAREPTLRTTKEGTLVADMRVGTASRYFDKKTGEWRDGDSSYFTVTCWRRLATAAKISLRKGEPVIVRGRFRTRSYERDGQPRTEVEITAEAFGHDLTRGVASFVQRGLPRDNVLDPRRIGGDAEEHDPDRDGEGPGDDQGDDGSMDVTGGIPGDIPPAGTMELGWDQESQDRDGTAVAAGRLLDEAAVARFSEGLADDGAVARELADEETDEAGSLRPR